MPIPFSLMGDEAAVNSFAERLRPRGEHSRGPRSVPGEVLAQEMEEPRAVNVLENPQLLPALPCDSPRTDFKGPHFPRTQSTAGLLSPEKHLPTGPRVALSEAMEQHRPHT